MARITSGRCPTQCGVAEVGDVGPAGRRFRLPRQGSDAGGRRGHLSSLHRRSPADQRAAEVVVAALDELLLDDRDLQNTYISGLARRCSRRDLRCRPGYSQPIVFGRLDGVHVRGSALPGVLAKGGILPADATRTCWPTRDLWPGHSANSTPSAPQPSMRRADALIDTLTTSGRRPAVHGGGRDATWSSPTSPTALTLSVGLAQARSEIAIADPGDLVFATTDCASTVREVDVLVRAFFSLPCSRTWPRGRRHQGGAAGRVACA